MNKYRNFEWADTVTRHMGNEEWSRLVFNHKRWNARTVFNNPLGADYWEYCPGILRRKNIGWYGQYEREWYFGIMDDYGNLVAVEGNMYG